MNNGKNWKETIDLGKAQWQVPNINVFSPIFFFFAFNVLLLKVARILKNKR